VRASVGLIMATFNGELWLGEQLRSTAAHTRRPDVLVISEVGSSVGTVGFAEKSARRARFETSIVLLPGKGSPLTSGHGMGQVDSDLAWSDQDDVWAPAELQCCERVPVATSSDFVSQWSRLIDSARRQQRRSRHEQTGRRDPRDLRL